MIKLLKLQIEEKIDTLAIMIDTNEVSMVADTNETKWEPIMVCTFFATNCRKGYVAYHDSGSWKKKPIYK